MALEEFSLLQVVLILKLIFYYLTSNFYVLMRIGILKMVLFNLLLKCKQELQCLVILDYLLLCQQVHNN
jgi:hypothetical protein